MEITQQAAEESLSAVKETMSRTRKSVEAGYAAGILILWGAIWMVEFTLAHFLPDRVGLIFNSLGAVGTVGTFIICWNWRRNGTMQTPQEWRMVLRIFAMWLALGCYAVLWLFIFRIPDGIRMCVFFCTVAMLGYVILGLWVEIYFMVWLGLAVTVLTVVGLRVPAEYFYLWMAPAGGGSLLGTGLYIRLRWR